MHLSFKQNVLFYPPKRNKMMSDAFTSFYYLIYFLLVISIFLKEQSMFIFSILTCYSPFELLFFFFHSCPSTAITKCPFFFFLWLLAPPCPNYQILSVNISVVLNVTSFLLNWSMPLASGIVLPS